MVRDGFHTDRDVIASLRVATVGGLAIAALGRGETAKLMITLALQNRSGASPILMSSANGEVISRCASDPRLKSLMAAMDVISADGQPLVFASRLLCETKLPERVATTDLFHDVAALAVQHGVSFYVLGATRQENERAMPTSASSIQS